MQDDSVGGPVEDVEVLVCRKCLVKGGARSGGMDLPRWLQGTLTDRGLGEHVRVMPSGCMNQCPRGKVTVLVTSATGRGGALVTVDPRLQREELVQLVERQARGESAPDLPPSEPVDDAHRETTEP
ncbi:hypothetical protein A176_001377 [Myxococcus hansupus]|uniref:(2Fe-2S) ferredoxin domain-containing protein n=1 Tax=Pseudomyxococcus hansupus TaxID=1297742 RepID=A0A0H4WSZ2_9BACT|nr:hypothetical protein A176_001377 [Myxococcus hansupus]